VNDQGVTEKLANELSQRERECLLWAARGKTYAEIALILGCSFASVKTHLDHCRYKLCCATLAQATATAAVRGLITADDLRGAL
jgi:LuxR family transcriptional activator of conjugal transfer of Ti plasmids